MINHQLTKQQLIETLESHLRKVGRSASDDANARDCYIKQLTSVLDGLKNGGYSEDRLPKQLSSLGFPDLAREIRWGKISV